MATQTLVTLEDVLALPDRDDCRYEVEDGELIEASLPRPQHQVAATNLVIDLGIYLRAHPVGRACASDTPFVLRREPLVLRGPDAAVILNGNLARVQPDQIIEGAPDIAVEVASPSNRPAGMLRRAAEFLEAGALEVWLVWPGRNEIHIHTQDGPPSFLAAADTLTSALLPGFAISVASVFV